MEACLVITLNLQTHPVTARIDGALITSGITIGLTQSSLTVPEETSPLQVCATIHSGSIAFAENFDVHVAFMLNVVPGTATATEGNRIVVGHCSCLIYDDVIEVILFIIIMIVFHEQLCGSQLLMD